MCRNQYFPWNLSFFYLVHICTSSFVYVWLACVFNRLACRLACYLFTCTSPDRIGFYDPTMLDITLEAHLQYPWGVSYAVSKEPFSGLCSCRALKTDYAYSQLHFQNGKCYRTRGLTEMLSTLCLPL